MTEFFEIVAKVAVLVFVVTCMATAGLGLGVRDIVAPMRRVRFVVLALVVNFVLAPALAYALTEVSAIDRPYAIGLLLLSASAGAPFLPKLAELAKGDIATSIALMLLLTVGSVVFLPITLPASRSRHVGECVADPAASAADDVAAAFAWDGHSRSVGEVGVAPARRDRQDFQRQHALGGCASHRAEFPGHDWHVRKRSSRGGAAVRRDLGVCRLFGRRTGAGFTIGTRRSARDSGTSRRHSSSPRRTRTTPKSSSCCS